jgi:hypothetical protein
MREWNLKHMQETIIKYVRGLPEDASRYEKKLYKRYGGIINVCKSIEYDLKHGVTTTELFSFLQRIVTEPSFSELCKNNASRDRLHEVKAHFT